MIMIFKKNIFTLVELLIVIAIIAVLVSILLPALRKAKYSSYRILCANNQKQIHIALSQYDIDYNGLPPLNVEFGSPLRWSSGWCGSGMLYTSGYINNGHVFFCPSPENMAWTPAARAGQGSYNGRNDNNIYGWEYGLSHESGTNSYIMNNYWLRWNLNTNYYEKAKMLPRLSLNSPERWLNTDHWGNYVFTADGYWNPHGTGINILFIDGHVSFYQITIATLRSLHTDYDVMRYLLKYYGTTP